MSSAIPSTLEANLSILSDEEKSIASMLVAENQSHLFDEWSPAGTHDAEKHAFFSQVKTLHDSYNDGHLPGYLRNARKLLESSRKGENPFDGWTPTVPSGVNLTPFSPEYNEFERMGLSDVSCCGFVLVAGGLGERLGYNGIKVELPAETTTGTAYLELYCKQILAMQAMSVFASDGSAKPSFLPLAIMVSDDTAKKTISLLESNSYFGLKKEQGNVVFLLHHFIDT